MAPKTLLLPLLGVAAAHTVPFPLLARDYVDTVCKPAIKSPSDTIPPCTEIQTIEMLCVANGTSPLYLEAHQQCMCNGSYFTEWPACQSCLFLHGLRSERDLAQYASILTAASSSFCDVPTPTASFAAVFSQVQAEVPVPTTGDTISSDKAPSQTPVSLYWTATGPQGPGRVTGSATGATATGLATAPQQTGGSAATGGGRGGGGSGSGTAGGPNPGTTSTTAPSGSASASTKPNGGMPVGGALPLGLAAAVGLGAGVVLGL